MPIDFENPSQISQYIQAISKTSKDALRWSGYYSSVEHAEDLAVHFEGKYPKKLLEDYRPNEPKEIHDYRVKIFQPVTKSKAKKIINVCKRIVNSRNYSIEFPQEVSSLLKNESFDESLEAYTLYNYPYYYNLLEWIFNVAFKQVFVDPNSIICFRPINYTEEFADDKFIEPFGFLYSSRSVVDKLDNEYYTILVEEKSQVKSGQQTKLEGNIYHIYTKNEIIEARQVGEKSDNKYEITSIYQHNFNATPVITLGGEYVNNSFPFLYESFVSGILPFWNDAIREYNDKQATFVQHVYLERVEIQIECDNLDCGKNGADPGYICVKDGHAKCTRCKGSGFISGRSPFGVTSVKKDQIGGEQPIFPGVEYIDKPTEIVELLKEDIKELIDQGFEAINMDILKQVGENQSGIAKTIDRTDLDSFLMQISDNLFENIVYGSFYFIALYRSISGTNAKDQMPIINKPTSFDVLTEGQMVDNLGTGANLPLQLKDALLIDIINKKYPNDNFLREYNKSLIELDPLRNKSIDEKFTASTNGWITKEDAILSENISKFILDAYEKDNSFFEKSRSEKMQILYSFIKSKNTIGGAQTQPIE